MERRLGRGLESLLGGGSTVEEGTKDSGVLELPIQSVRPNPEQPRKLFENDSLEELKQSILQHGVLQPICVRPAGSEYQIVAGERRWRASRLAGLESIPAIVHADLGDHETMELALVENLQREDLDPLEKAQAFQFLIGELGTTQEEVARKVGLNRATVANHLRLLELPGEVQEAVSAGLMTMGHARALLGLSSSKEMILGLSKAVREEMSVRQVEQWVKARVQKAEAGPKASAKPVRSRSVPAWVMELEGRMREALGTKVSVHNGSGYKGQIVIHYHDREELERVSERLAPRDTL